MTICEKFKTEKEKRWFGEVVRHLRTCGVKGKITYAGSGDGWANAIRPDVRSSDLYLVCGELSKPGNEATEITDNCAGFASITSIPGGFHLVREARGIELSVREWSEAKYGAWVNSPLDSYVNRRGEEIPCPQ